VWREVREIFDQHLVQLIRGDGVDILTWPTGIEAIDYRLTGPRLDPPGSDAYPCLASMKTATPYKARYPTNRTTMYG
jgi:hypothetical protein